MNSPKHKKSHTETSIAIIGQHLSALRKSKGLTRAAVAYQANISLTSLYRLETGKYENVGIWALFEVCKYYGIEPYTLLTKNL